jgi:hypothetical protein
MRCMCWGLGAVNLLRSRSSELRNCVICELGWLEESSTITCFDVADAVAQIIDKNGMRHPKLMRPNVITSCAIGSLNVPMAKHVRIQQLQQLTPRLLCRASPYEHSIRCFSVLNRPKPNYEGHIPLTRMERLSLAVGSGLGSFIDPRRAGMTTLEDIPDA